jgi:Ty3 transposon capsid-like protein
MSTSEQYNELLKAFQDMQVKVHQLQQQVVKPQAPSKERLNKPPTFDGGSRSNVHSWLLSMDQYLTLSEVAADRKVLVATTFLVGTATLWWQQEIDTHRKAPFSWEAFGQKMMERFRAVEASAMGRVTLHSFKQVSTIEKYNHRFLDIVQVIDDMTEKEKIDRYIVGLRKDLRRELIKLLPSSLTHAMQIATRYEMLDQGTTTEGNYSRNNSSSYHRRPYRPQWGMNRPAATSSSQPVPMELGNLEGEEEEEKEEGQLNAFTSRPRIPFNRLSPEERERLMAEGKCFRCKQKGHMAHTCPQANSQNHPKGRAQ